jgi:hypothetical protein
MAGNKRMPYGLHYSRVILKMVATLLLIITYYSIDMLLKSGADYRYNDAGVGYYIIMSVICKAIPLAGGWGATAPRLLFIKALCLIKVRGKVHPRRPTRLGI